MFLAVYEGIPGHSGMLRGIMGCSRGVLGLFRAVPGCSGGVPGMFRGVPGVFRGVPGCSGCVPGVFRVLQTPAGHVILTRQKVKSPKKYNKSQFT